jgi:DNA mismatch repair protein MutL
MARVQLLPDHLINQIAAGEVVERPASIVKELVENALDAGARRIEIEVENGGKRRIRIVDDGHGMSREDAMLSVQRHATSKIRSQDDLFQILTKGFRGEALPSIASVSRFRLQTCTAEDELGTEVMLEGGQEQRVTDVGRSVGTTIEVSELFFNLPARRKFLKSDGTEFAHISEAVVRLAMSHPNVRFRLTHNRSRRLDAPATTDLRERVETLLGRDVGRSLYPVEMEASNLSIRGLFSKPDITTHGSKGIYIFVNGRFIRQKSLTHACREAYRGTIEKGRYPYVILFLEIDPAEVDVNVHPQKIEVRFRREDDVYGRLMNVLRTAIARAPWAESNNVLTLPEQPQAEQRSTGPASQPAPSTQSTQVLPQSTPPPSNPVLSPNAIQEALRQQHPQHSQQTPSTRTGLNTSPLPPPTSFQRGTEPTQPVSQRPVEKGPTPAPSTNPLQTSGLQTGQTTEKVRQASLEQTSTARPPATPLPRVDEPPPTTFEGFAERFNRLAGESLVYLTAPETLPEHPQGVPPLPDAQGDFGFIPGWDPPSSGATSNGALQTQSAVTPQGTPQETPQPRTPPRVGFYASMRYIGQFSRMYLLFEKNDTLYLLDQHAAHERVSYQRLLDEYEKIGIPQQHLLTKPRIELSLSEVEWVEEHKEDLERLGISLEPFGGRTYVLHAMPALLKKANPRQLVRDLLDELSEGRHTGSFDEHRDDVLMRMACHGSVRGPHTLSASEVRALMEQLDDIEFRGHCPHGRPVLIQFSKKELEKRFHRT